MHAVVLAGGPGRRLRPYTAVLPKILLPIGDRPVLDIVLRQLRASGVSRVTIATGHLVELIQAFCGGGQADGLDVHCHHEQQPMGTAGALTALPELDEPFIVLAGAVLTDLDYAQLMLRHCETDAAMTVVTAPHELRISLGVLEFEDAADRDRLTGYDEKPTYHLQTATGIYACSPGALRYLAAEEQLDLHELITRLIAAGETVLAHCTTAKHLDLGQYDDYESALEEFHRLGPWPVLAGDPTVRVAA